MASQRSESQERLFLIDGSSFVFKAYHALPPLTRRSDALPVGAVAGFCNMLWRLLMSPPGGVSPTHLAIAFDTPAPTFRAALYSAYKANRPPPPEDLAHQFGLCREAARAFVLPCIAVDGFEADDVIATYAAAGADRGFDVWIMGNDKDLFQCLRPGVRMYDTIRRRETHAQDVEAKYGVAPAGFVDLQGLMGDSTDNIPGVPGIGPKIAAELLQEWGTLDKVLANAASIPQRSRRKRLLEHADDARLSRSLARLKTDVPLPFGLDDLYLERLRPDRLLGFMKALEFNSLAGRIAVALGVDLQEFDATPALTAPPTPTEGPDDLRSGPAPTKQLHPSLAAQAIAGKITALPWDRTAYTTVVDSEVLNRWIERIHRVGIVGFDIETTSLDIMSAELLGISLAVPVDDVASAFEACFVPTFPLADSTHAEHPLRMDGNPPAALSRESVLSAIIPVLESGAIIKVGHNLKYDWGVLAGDGVVPQAYDDTMLMSHIIAEGEDGHGLDACCRRWLDHNCLSFAEITADQKGAKTFARVPRALQTAYAAEDAEATLRLWYILKPRMLAAGLSQVYAALEKPLIGVLIRMERHGIQIDRAHLEALSEEFSAEMLKLETEIHGAAETAFNPASPKQLGTVLFDKLGLPGGRKTKSGTWSTAANTLEVLASQGHILPKKILAWRQLQKLRSTYTETLPRQIDRKTQRIHTSYALAATRTGRLASSNPNLQNIPVRTPEGQRIRAAFVCPPGRMFLAADYSQIELRLLAHLADVGALKRAFANGEDIHRHTASLVFGVPEADVTPDLRRRAKAINFGIVYGISAFGLGNQLGIPRSEAQAIIDAYFRRFPGIAEFLDAIRNRARETGHVESLAGRRMSFPNIRSKNHAERTFNERAAINAPIQGSAADIIRLAMIEVDRRLGDEFPTAKLLLQIHDELIVEADASDGKGIAGLLSDAMTNAAHLSVPLVVDVRTGIAWSKTTATVAA